MTALLSGLPVMDIGTVVVTTTEEAQSSQSHDVQRIQMQVGIYIMLMCNELIHDDDDNALEKD